MLVFAEEDVGMVGKTTFVLTGAGVGSGVSFEGIELGAFVVHSRKAG
jgi:hypothetical protein